MTVGQFVLQALAGLANAMFLFLVASGLSLIFAELEADERVRQAYLLV